MQMNVRTGTHALVQQGSLAHPLCIYICAHTYKSCKLLSATNSAFTYSGLLLASCTEMDAQMHSEILINIIVQNVWDCLVVPDW